VSGSNLPATRCSFDANFNLIGCSDTTIDADVAWSGQGPISRSVSVEHTHRGGLTIVDHFNGTVRDATATGTVAGVTLTADDLEFADLASTNTGRVQICIGCF
jgi:hypothetical protein